jgi:prepilin-type N-terminal cleavage/methylation domain-containing protein
MKRRVDGFTIVELLIVIVVIAILASVTVVAFNGVQERATYSATQRKFQDALKAIMLYHADKGEYPNSENCASGYYHIWCGFNQGVDNGFIPGVVPEYVSTVQNLDPSLPDRINGGPGGDTMLYMSRAANGLSVGTTEFNLIRYRNVNGQGLSELEKIGNDKIMDDYVIEGVSYGWGYRSNPAHPWY